MQWKNVNQNKELTKIKKHIHYNQRLMFALAQVERLTCRHQSFFIWKIYKNGGSDMYCVVINKLKGIYMLRHIIYGINPKESMSSIKKNYYKNYCRTDTDTFYLCKNKKEINKLLLMHKISF